MFKQKRDANDRQGQIALLNQVCPSDSAFEDLIIELMGVLPLNFKEDYELVIFMTDEQQL